MLRHDFCGFGFTGADSFFNEGELGGTRNRTILFATLTNIIFSISHSDYTATSHGLVTRGWQFAVGPQKMVGTNFVIADDKTGSDWGSKVNKASAALKHGGEIWVSRLAGMNNATPVNISADGQILRFVEGGTFISSLENTVSGNGSGIAGIPCGQGDFNTPSTCPVVIQEAAGANLTQLVRITGRNTKIQDVQFDGNKDAQAFGDTGVIARGSDACLKIPSSETLRQTVFKR